MLIITADDWGRSRTATDAAAQCLKRERITSASAMVFMADSERAAEIGRASGLDSGLHLNFTQTFDGNMASGEVARAQQRIGAFLRTSKWSPFIYNPWLRHDFRLVYVAQCDEYLRLYRRDPTHVDGHHHMHLCANMLVDRLMPPGTRVRRNFSFFPREKAVLNRLYRRCIDAILIRRYACTDFFFSVPVPPQIDRFRQVISLAESRDVELMTHPERPREFDFLMSEPYAQLISGVKRGTYAGL